MADLTGDEEIDVWQGGRKIRTSIRDITRKFFVVMDNASTSYRVKVADMGTRQRMTAGSAVTLVIPDEASRTIFQNYDTFEVEQAGAGQVTAVGESGVPVIDAAEMAKTAKQYAILQFTRVAANHWTCSGYQATS